MGLSLFSRLPVLVALGIAVFAFPTASMAQQSGGTPGTVKSNHGAWSIVCDKPAGASAEQCALMQNVIAEDRPEVGLSVVVLKTADRKAKILRVLAPLGVLSMSTARISAVPISCAVSPTAATRRSCWKTSS
jgi:invasion protein IalB